METVYRSQMVVPTYMVGPDMTLRPSALLRLQQEAGERQLAESGGGAAVLRERGLAFVVTRLRVQVHRMPQMGETVTLSTWHREHRGVQFFRCYTFADAAGNPLIESVSAFALVDIATHHLLRPDALGGDMLISEPMKNGCPDPKKETPPSLHEVASVRPRWSELDQNGHVNNTCYADYLCDYLPSGMPHKRVTGFSICFEREILPDDRLVLSAAEERMTVGETTGGSGWLAGMHNRGQAFVARLDYEDDYDRRF